MKIWVGKHKEEEPKPYLAIRLYADGRLGICAVALDGHDLCIISHEDGYVSKAKNLIERAGYSTSWAEWNSEGRFVKMLEGIEP